MKRFFLWIFLISATGWANAGPYSDALGNCFSESTTGRDRIDFARWVFMAMAKHPGIKDLSNVTPDALEDTSMRVGALYTRLMTESCAKQTKAAVQNEGEGALRAAYEVLGKLGMQELIVNPQVTGVFTGTSKYVDAAKIRAAMDAK
ncbi:hypothetical protein [uncultured Rhodoferax sp.]|uniref:hypothetical protein n=1 Tax=uncultured Rhodoferax sp. TaxID=223188 RepID=UPI0025DD5EA5|nr:hypothetical protein [uncultured Rhodoferax sp.]